MRALLLCGLLALAACGEDAQRLAAAAPRLAAVEQALDEGKLGTAEEMLTELAEFDEMRVARRVHFLRGNLSFAQAKQRLQRAQAALGKADDWKECVRLARVAQRHWKGARGESLDWPAARRNVERAERWIAEVLDLAEQAGVELNPGDATEQNPVEPPPPPEGEQEEAPQMPPPPTPERIDSLLERVRQQEERKRSERRAVPGLDAPEVERDW